MTWLHKHKERTKFTHVDEFSHAQCKIKKLWQWLNLKSMWCHPARKWMFSVQILSRSREGSNCSLWKITWSILCRSSYCKKNLSKEWIKTFPVESRSHFLPSQQLACGRITSREECWSWITICSRKLSWPSRLPERATVSWGSPEFPGGHQITQLWFFIAPMGFCCLFFFNLVSKFQTCIPSLCLRLCLVVFFCCKITFTTR